MTEKETKAKTDLYYKQEELAGDVKSALQETRKEPGISIQSVSNIIKSVFSGEEIKSLIDSLEKADYKIKSKNL